jgi:hypothetical protein
MRKTVETEAGRTLKRDEKSGYFSGVQSLIGETCRNALGMGRNLAESAHGGVKIGRDRMAWGA